MARAFDTGGHNFATFFVGQHEKVVLAEVHGHGRLIVTATDPNGSVIIEGATVYDSAAHFLSGGGGAAAAGLNAAEAAEVGPALEVVVVDDEARGQQDEREQQLPAALRLERLA